MSMIASVLDFLQSITAHTTPGARIIVGLQGVQGIGKSTLAGQLVASSRENSDSDTRIVATISLDDFYLPHDALVSLADDHDEFRVRGNPGTHDLDALQQALDDFAQGREYMRVPVYDKAARAGRGDRIGWKEIPCRLHETKDDVDKNRHHILFLEGWCVGFHPDMEDGRATVIDTALQLYSALWSRLHGLIVLEPPHLGIVYEWREESEAARRCDGKGAMTQEEVRYFVDVYMPTYRRYLPTLKWNRLRMPVRRLRLDARRCLYDETTATSLA